MLYPWINLSPEARPKQFIFPCDINGNRWFDVVWPLHCRCPAIALHRSSLAAWGWNWDGNSGVPRSQDTEVFQLQAVSFFIVLTFQI